MIARLDIYTVERWLQMAQQSSYNVKLFCKTADISRRQLQRYTHKLFGRSPQAWLNHQRMVAAADMLKAHRCVKLVAFNLGFKQVSHFSRSFRLHYTLSPSAFLMSGNPSESARNVNPIVATAALRPPVSRILRRRS